MKISVNLKMLYKFVVLEFHITFYISILSWDLFLYFTSGDKMEYDLRLPIIDNNESVWELSEDCWDFLVYIMDQFHLDNYRKPESTEHMFHLSVIHDLTGHWTQNITFYIWKPDL